MRCKRPVSAAACAHAFLALPPAPHAAPADAHAGAGRRGHLAGGGAVDAFPGPGPRPARLDPAAGLPCRLFVRDPAARRPCLVRSEEHTSELQSLMRISYAVFCLKKNK